MTARKTQAAAANSLNAPESRPRTVEDILGYFEQRYAILIREGESYMNEGKLARARLSFARAVEVAVFMYYEVQRGTDPELLARWETRRQRAEALAYTKRNATLDPLGVPTPTEPVSRTHAAMQRLNQEGTGDA